MNISQKIHLKNQTSCKIHFHSSNNSPLLWNAEILFLCLKRRTYHYFK